MARLRSTFPVLLPFRLNFLDASGGGSSALTVAIADDLNSWSDRVLIARLIGQGDSLNNWADSIQISAPIFAQGVTKVAADTMTMYDSLIVVMKSSDSLLVQIFDRMFMADDFAMKQEVGQAESLNNWSDAIAYQSGTATEAFDTMQYNWLDAIVAALLGVPFNDVADDMNRWDDSITVTLKNPSIERSVADNLNNWAESLAFNIGATQIVIFDAMTLADELAMLMSLALVISGDSLNSWSDAINIQNNKNPTSFADSMTMSDAIVISMSQPLTRSVSDSLNNWADSATRKLPSSNLAYLRRFLNDVVSV